jgi:hypothetical protein
MYPSISQARKAALDRYKTIDQDAPTPTNVDPRSTGEIVETRYDNDINYYPGQDYTDIRAARQGSLEAAGNILGRNLGKFGLRTLDGASFFLTAPGTLMKRLATGEIDSWGDVGDAVIDNPVSQGLRKAEEWLDQQMPIYESRAQQNSIDITSAGFVDKILNGVAYVGAMAVGGGLAKAGAKGILQLAKSAGGYANLGRIFGNAIEEGRDINYIANLFGDAAALSDELGKIKTGQKITNGLKENLSDIYGGVIESAAEASQTKEEVVRQLTEEATRLNNGQPLTEEQQKRINEEGSQAMLSNFGINMIATGAANKILYHKLLNNKWSDDMVAYNKVVKNGDQYAMKEAANKVGKYNKLFQPIKNFATSELAKGAATEGAQEGVQFASNDFFVNLYSNPDRDSIGKVDNVLRSLTETGKNLGNKDALESMLIGGMIGAGFGHVLNRGKDKAINENTQQLINRANLFSVSNSIKELARNTKYSDAADGAMINGDRITYETLKAAQVYDLVASRDQIGKFGDIKTELESARNMDLNTFKTKYDIIDPDYSEAKRAQFIDYVSDIADKTKTARTKLMNNYGHKLTALEAENPDITNFLTMVDVLKEDYTRREQDLFTKLSPYMKYEDVVTNALTPEKLEDYRGQITTLETQVKDIQNEPANTPDQLIDKTNRLKTAVNRIAELQNAIAISPTEANYKDFLKINGLNDEKTEKKPREATRYAEYTKDLNDFKEIQKTKESLINYYSKIVNDVDYAKKVQEQINLANNSEVLDGIFSLDFDVQSTPKIDNNNNPISFNGRQSFDYKLTKPQDGQAGTVQDYIRTGDIYRLHRRQVKKEGGKYTGIDTYAPYEVVDTFVEMQGNVPVGKIKLKDQRGKTSTLSANQFKDAIRPFEYNGEIKYKYDQEAENVRFYRMFKDRAIKYNINGKEVVGMLGFSPEYAEDLVLKYFEDGKLYNVKFKTTQFGKDFQKGYIKVLSERETLAYQLNENAKGYLNSLIKGVESNNKALNTTAKRVQDLNLRLRTAMVNENTAEADAINRTIAGYDRLVEKIEKELEIKEAAIQRLEVIEPIDIEQLDSLPEDLNKQIDKVKELVDATRAIAQNRDTDGKLPKQIRRERLRKAMEIELEGEITTKDAIIKQVNTLKQAFIDKVSAQLGEGDASQLTNADINPTLDFQYVDALRYSENAAEGTSLSTYIADANTIAEYQNLANTASDNLQAEIEALTDEYTARLLDATNLTVDDITDLKTAELAAITKFIKFINERGFAPDNRKFNRKVEQTEYKLPEPGEEEVVTRRSDLRMKTTGNSELTTNPHQREFYRQIQKIGAEHSAKILSQEEQTRLNLPTGDQDFFVKIIDKDGNDVEFNGNKLITTIPLNNLKDTYGFRFREFEKSPIKKEIGNRIDAAIRNISEGTISVSTSSRPIIGETLDWYDSTDNFIEPVIVDRIVAPLKEGSTEKVILKRADGSTINKSINELNLFNKTKNTVSYRRRESPTNLFESLNNVTDQLVKEYPAETDFIQEVKDHVEEVQRTRELIAGNRAANITFPIVGKSNGIPNISPTIQVSPDAISSTGRVVVADSNTYTSAGNVYQVSPGRAYFEDADKALFFAVVVEPIGNKTIAGTKTTFVDNIVNAGKYVQAAIQDKAFDSRGKTVTPVDARTAANNMLSLITYTNKNVDKPDSVFEYAIENNEVVFYIGSTTPLRLNNEEALIRELLSKKIFNIDRASLDKATVRFDYFGEQADGSYKNFGFKTVNYQEFIKDNFGVKTNIVQNKFGALFENGYIVLSPNPFISEDSVLDSEARKETGENTYTSTSGGLLAGLRSSVAVDETRQEESTGDPFGSTENPFGPGIQQASTFLASLGSSVKGRKLIEKVYKGDSNNRMTPQQLRSARKRFEQKYQVKFDLIKGLIDNDAFGMVNHAGEVLLSDIAPVGTDYHEEFHLVSQHILDRNQLKDLYDQWRTRNNSEVNDDVVEEELAEAFRIHAQGYEGFTGKIKEIFDYLMNQIKKLLRMNSLQDTLFNDIYRGKYYNKGTYAGTKAYKSSAGLNYETRQKAFRGATQQLVYGLIDSFARNEVTTNDQITTADRIQAINLLATDKDARLDYLNYVDEDGNSFFRQSLINSLRAYIETANDLTAHQLGSYINTETFNEILTEYTAFVSKELNLKGLEEADINEDTTGRDIVKRGDNEIDFFNEAITQMRLLAYTQSDLTGKYPINPATLTKIYIDNLADSKNSEDFENKLKGLGSSDDLARNYGAIYNTAINNINQIVGINNPNRTKAQQFMIGNLWSSFSKISTDFKILKVTDSEDGFGLDYYWVEASKEAALSNAKRDLNGTIKDNFVVAKSRIVSTNTNSKGEPIVANPNEVFEALFDIPANKFNTLFPNKIQSIVNTVARVGNVDEYLKNNGNDMNVLSQYMTSHNIEKVFSFFNAGGKLQHGLQNPSSLTYRLRDISKDSDILTLDKGVVINGIQKSISRDVNNRTSDDITEADLHILFFNSMIPKNKEGAKSIMPFIFSGDKSTLAGIEFTPKRKLLFGNTLKQNTVNGVIEYNIDHTEIYNEYFKDELEDLVKVIELNKEDIRISKGGVKEDLPFFSFMKKTNLQLYDSIIKDVKALSKQSMDNIENIASRYKEEVMRETQDFFKEKGKQIKAEFENIGYDYKSTLAKNAEIGDDLSDAYLNWYASAYAIGIQEQTKLVGSLNFYDQPAKRLPAWNGVKRAIRTDKDWVNWYNKTYNSDINVGDLRALTINDVEHQNDIELYKGNNPADAQAYISLDAARFLLFSSGTYSYRLDDLFRDIQDLEKKPNLSAKDIENLNKNVSELNEYINILKPQYYGMQNVGNLEVPTFYKFSVLPLSKVLTQGKNLDNIRELMAAENGPHIVMFDSANKVGRLYTKGLDLYKENGDYNFNDVPMETKMAAIQHSSWEGLGIQVDMPKAHETVTFGSQMRKLITVDLDGIYHFQDQDWTPEQIRTKVDDLIIEKLKSDKEDLMKKLGLNEDLEVTPDKIEGVKKELIRMAIARDFSIPFIDSIRRLNSFDFVSNKSKMQQMVNSIVSKGVIKQKMHGDAKAMVSSVGFERKNGGVQADKRLKFYSKKDGRSYMEVLLPNNMLDQYKDHVEFNEAENLFTFKANANEEIRKLIGYRIPTQAPVSIENIRIKGFLPAAYGNAVAVPFELTSKAGSDFDIDKLNLFMPKFRHSISDKEITKLLDQLPQEYFNGVQLSRLEYYKVLEETLAEDLEATDTSILKYVRDNAKGRYKYNQGHIDNRIIEFFTNLMSSPRYYDNFVTTIDTFDFRDLAKEIGTKRGLQKSAADEKNSANFYDPLYNARRRSSFMNAKDTLGAVALATTHHAESQKHKLAINSTTLNNGKEARIVKGEGTAATIGELFSLFEPNIVENGKVRLDRIFNFENKKISGILSELVNASVDAAKDDYITSANLDLETVGVATLMIRAGIPIGKVFNFISQPGIIAYTDAMRRTKIAALPGSNKGQVNDKFNGGNYLDLKTNDFNVESLARGVETSTMTKQQLNFIDLYKNIAEYAQMLTDLQQVSNFDTKSTGSMLEENEINLFKYDQFVKNYSRMFSGVDSMFNEQKSFTARMREEARNANNLNNSLFKIGGLYTSEDNTPIVSKELKAQLETIFASKDKSANKANKAFKLKNYFNTYLLQKVASINYPEFARVLPKTIAQIKQYKGTDNTFLKRLRTGDNKLFFHGGASIAADEANILAESFADLYNSPETKELATNIMLSGLYQFGVVNNPSTIMNVIPTTLLLDTLKLNTTDPLIQAANIVTKADGSLAKAVANAWEHTKSPKGSNHFNNYVLVKPEQVPTSFDYANEKHTDC